MLKRAEPIVGGVVILAVIVFAGLAIYWQVTGIHSGYVTNKDYRPAYTSIETTTTTTKGKTTTTTRTVFHPAWYTLSLRLGDKTNWVSVAGETYWRVKVGDFYDDKCSCVIPK